MSVPLKWSPTVWSTWFQFPPPAAPSQAGCTTPPVVIFVWPSASLGGPVTGSSLMPPPVSQQIPSGNSTQASAVAPPRRRTASIEGTVINIFRIFIAKSPFETRLVAGTRTAILNRLHSLMVFLPPPPQRRVLVGQA